MRKREQDKFEADLNKSYGYSNDNNKSTSKVTLALGNVTATEKKVDLSAEARLREQQQFEAYLNNKYQSNSNALIQQQVAVTA